MLRYATEDNFTNRYREGQEFSQAERLREQNLRSGQQEYDIREEGRANILRRGTAEADRAESQARVAKGTEGYDISRSGSQADQASSDARRAGTLADSSAFEFGEDQANAPNVRRRIESEADSAGTSARRQEFELGEQQATAPDARRTSQANATTAEQNARRAGAEADFALNRRKYELFDKSMAALAAGNIEMAMALAQQNGQQIPPAILQDARKQKAMSNLWEQAKQMYPNQPQKQVQYLKAALQQMMTSSGEVNYDPAKAVNVPGAPEPDPNAYGVVRPGGRGVPASQVQVPGTLSAADGRLIAQVKLKNTTAPLYGFGEDTIDVGGMAQDLMRLGRPDLARIFDATMQAPTTTPPIMPPGQPQGPVGSPGGTPPYVPTGQPGVGPMPGAGAQPPRPQTLRGISQLNHSASRRQFQDAQTGFIYDLQGNRVR